MALSLYRSRSSWRLRLRSLEPYAHRIVVVFLLVVGSVMALSVKDDTLTTDEGLYLPTGYRFLTEGNIRIGFEHPPLMRVIAALPLVVFLDLKPASEFINEYNKDLNGEVWAYGDKFIYNQTESAEDILFAGRLPMIAFCIGFLYFVYRVVRRRYGWLEGAVVTVLLGLSPFFLAHGRLVTLDVPTAFAAFLVLFAVGRFLERGDRSSMVYAGMALGIAQLIKFSMLTMLPFLLVVGSFYVWQFKKGEALVYARRAFGLGTVALALIGAVYSLHILNYPVDQQLADINYVLSTTRPDAYPMLKWIAWLAQFQIGRPWAEYFFGAAWQLTRHGAFGYFMGEGSNTSWTAYYPVGYLLKQPLAFHALTLVALFHCLRFVIKLPGQNWLKFIRGHLFLFLGVLWTLFYLFALIGLNSGNTGSRYLLPILPFIAILVGVGSVRWIKSGRRQAWKAAAIGFLIVAQLVSVVSVYPSFLAYFNTLVDAERGSHFLVDSDADWGQDTKRLDDWLRLHSVPRINLAIQFAFQSASGAVALGQVYSDAYLYYLKDRFDVLKPGVPTTGWVVVPGRLLRWGQSRPADKEGWSSDSFAWLAGYKPVAVIGNSIFIFNIPP